jgi:hypothetical protein
MNYELTRKTEQILKIFPTGFEFAITKQKNSEEN